MILKAAILAFLLSFKSLLAANGTTENIKLLYTEKWL